MNENRHLTENNDGLTLSSSELKYGGVGLIFSLFFVFAGGYFLGKKRAYDELAVRYEDSCFADKVNQSLFSLYEQSDSENEPIGEEDACAETSLSVEPASVGQDNAEKSDDVRELAYAQLCGFGTRKMAELYAIRLQKRNIKTIIVERQSHSKKGKMVTWYQVVTEAKDKRELKELVKELENDDKLTGVEIVDVSLDDNR